MVWLVCMCVHTNWGKKTEKEKNINSNNDGNKWEMIIIILHLKRNEKKNCRVNAVLFCHRMELIVAYNNNSGPQQHSTALAPIFLCYFSIIVIFFFFVRKERMMYIQIKPKIYSIRSHVRFGIQNIVKRASECVMKCEHGHNDLSHINIRTQHLNLSFIFKYLWIFVVFFFRWPSSIWFKFTWITCCFVHAHMSCRSNGVQSHLSPNLWFSLAFFLCLVFFFHIFFPYFIDYSVCF